MLNFGWAELMVIGVVALIVIGPDDLPNMFRQLGRFTAKLRQMSREFSRAMEQAGNDTGVKDVARDLKNITSSKAMGLDAVKSAADKFEKWDPLKNAAKPSVPSMASAATAKPLVPPPMPATPSPSVADIDPEALDDMIDWDAEPDRLATPTPAPMPSPMPSHGPATQALYDKQAAKTSVIAEQTAKLKAIDNGTHQPGPTLLPPAAAVRKRAVKPRPVAPDAASQPESATATTEQAAKRARKPSNKADPT